MMGGKGEEGRGKRGVFFLGSDGVCGDGFWQDRDGELGCFFARLWWRLSYWLLQDREEAQKFFLFCFCGVCENYFLLIGKREEEVG